MSGSSERAASRVRGGHAGFAVLGAVLLSILGTGAAVALVDAAPTGRNDPNIVSATAARSADDPGTSADGCTKVVAPDGTAAEPCDTPAPTPLPEPRPCGDLPRPEGSGVVPAIGCMPPPGGRAETSIDPAGLHLFDVTFRGTKPAGFSHLVRSVEEAAQIFRGDVPGWVQQLPFDRDALVVLLVADHACWTGGAPRSWSVLGTVLRVTADRELPGVACPSVTSLSYAAFAAPGTSLRGVTSIELFNE